MEIDEKILCMNLHLKWFRVGFMAE